MIIWICILSSLMIYLGIGVYVFRARSKLRQMSGSDSHVRGVNFKHPVLADEGDVDGDNRV